MTSTRRIDRHLFALFAALALLAYAAWVGVHTSPVAAGSDSAGYLISARLLTEGRLTTPMRTVPEFPVSDHFEYTPLGLIHSERHGALIPTYPIGLPLLHALAAVLAGWTLGPILVATLMACGAVAGTYALTRACGVERPLAILGAVGLAVCPLVLHTTFQPLSDTASACCNALALLCALRARQHLEPRAPARGPKNGTRGTASLWAAGAGAAVAATVLIRPANLLVLPAVALLLARPRLLAAAFVAGLPGAVFLGWYHQALYGSALTTGYGSVWAIFGSEYVAPTLHKYITWVPAFLPLSVAAVACCWAWPWRERGREIAALLLWVVAYGAFYACYQPTHEHRWYLRFILPAFPALVVLGALGLQHALARVPAPAVTPARRGVLGLTLAISLVLAWHHGRRPPVVEMKMHADVSRALPVWAAAELPREAVILSLHQSASFYFYTEFPVIRSDVLRADRFAALRAAVGASGRPVFAVLHEIDDARLLDGTLRGPWREVRRMGSFVVWQLEPDP